MVLLVFSTTTFSQERREFRAFTSFIIEETEATIIEQDSDENSYVIATELPGYYGLDRVKQVTGNMVREYSDIKYRKLWHRKGEAGSTYYYAIIQVDDLPIFLFYIESKNQLLLYYTLQEDEDDD